MVHRLNHQWLAPLGPKKCFFGRFFLSLSRIKRPQVMSLVNFGYDFFFKYIFLGYPVDTNKYKYKYKYIYKYKWTALDVWIVDIVVTDNERRSDISKYIKYSFVFCKTGYKT